LLSSVTSLYMVKYRINITILPLKKWDLNPGLHSETRNLNN